MSSRSFSATGNGHGTPTNRRDRQFANALRRSLTNVQIPSAGEYPSYFPQHVETRLSHCSLKTWNRGDLRHRSGDEDPMCPVGRHRTD